MIYRVTRTSGDKKKPCYKAYLGETFYVDPATGKRVSEKVWFVKLNSLEDLNEFVRENGETIVSYQNWYLEYPYELEIHDDYLY